jgi:predicted acylesterase/phospholipase RssA
MVVKNIVFTGGGLKGWAYIGTIKALNEYIPFNEIEQIGGVSVGSLFGLMYLLQVPWQTLLDYSMNLNYSDIVDIDIDNILLNQSVMCGNKFMKCLREFIALRIDPDITFQQLYKYSKILFTVNAFNISDSRIDYFNYKLTPDVKVVDAIRASCNLPGIFPCYVINGKNYYDGGICNNTPTNGLSENDTIVFDICFEKQQTSNIKMVDLIYSMMHILNENKNNDHLVYKILDSRFTKQTYNFNQTKDDIFNIYMTGYKNSRERILENHILIKH